MSATAIWSITTRPCRSSVGPQEPEVTQAFGGFDDGGLCRARPKAEFFPGAVTVNDKRMKLLARRLFGRNSLPERHEPGLEHLCHLQKRGRRSDASAR